MDGTTGGGGSDLGRCPRLRGWCQQSMGATAEDTATNGDGSQVGRTRLTVADGQTAGVCWGSDGEQSRSW